MKPLTNLSALVGSSSVGFCSSHSFHTDENRRLSGILQVRVFAGLAFAVCTVLHLFGIVEALHDQDPNRLDRH